MGAFYYGPGQTNCGWFLVTGHGTTFTETNFYESYSKWRLCMFLHSVNATDVYLAVTFPDGSGWTRTPLYSVPVNLRAGWIHEVVLFPLPNVEQGTTKLYVNGNLVGTQTNMSYSVGGSQGGYEIKIVFKSWELKIKIINLFLFVLVNFNQLIHMSI